MTIVVHINSPLIYDFSNYPNLFFCEPHFYFLNENRTLHVNIGLLTLFKNFTDKSLVSDNNYKKERLTRLSLYLENNLTKGIIIHFYSLIEKINDLSDHGISGVQYTYKLVKKENIKLNTFYNKYNNKNSFDFYNTPKVLFIFHNIIWKLVVQVAKLYGIEVWDGKTTTKALISSNSASLFYLLFSIVRINHFYDILRASKANSKNKFNRYIIDSKKDPNIYNLTF